MWNGAYEEGQRSTRDRFRYWPLLVVHDIVVPPQNLKGAGTLGHVLIEHSLKLSRE